MAISLRIAILPGLKRRSGRTVRFAFGIDGTGLECTIIVTQDRHYGLLVTISQPGNARQKPVANKRLFPRILRDEITQDDFALRLLLLDLNLQLRELFAFRSLLLHEFPEADFGQSSCVPADFGDIIHAILQEGKVRPGTIMAYVEDVYKLQFALLLIEMFCIIWRATAKV
jgi:hypothetical protein